MFCKILNATTTAELEKQIDKFIKFKKITSTSITFNNVKGYSALIIYSL